MRQLGESWANRITGEYILLCLSLEEDKNIISGRAGVGFGDGKKEK
jgi:hypothetical protein